MLSMGLWHAAWQGYFELDRVSELGDFFLFCLTHGPRPRPLSYLLTFVQPTHMLYQYFRVITM